METGRQTQGKKITQAVWKGEGIRSQKSHHGQTGAALGIRSEGKMTGSGKKHKRETRIKQPIIRKLATKPRKPAGVRNQWAAAGPCAAESYLQVKGGGTGRAVGEVRRQIGKKRGFRRKKGHREKKGVSTFVRGRSTAGNWGGGKERQKKKLIRRARKQAGLPPISASSSGRGGNPKKRGKEKKPRKL